jgi:hypothetical protein
VPDARLAISAEGGDLIAELDRRIESLVDRIYGAEVWLAVMSQSTPAGFAREVLKEVYLEIYSYQPHRIAATIAIIGRMPKDDPKMMNSMLIHQTEEADHGEMALRDYVRLGGDEHYARSRRISPASFAVASIWWGILQMEDPFCYLGALYMFDGLTPIVCQRAVQALGPRDFPKAAMEFLGFHAAGDLGYSRLLRRLLSDAGARYPKASESITYGLDCAMAVYPLPVWQTAYERAKANWKGGMERA